MKTLGIVAFLSILSLAPTLQAQSGQSVADREILRKQAQKHQQQGNYKEALEAYSTLATDPQENPGQIGNDLQGAVACMQSLNRIGEADAFREKVVGLHAENWRALAAAANSLFQGDHSGTLVAGVFERGPHRGQGRFVNAEERDRIRALQWMVKAMTLLEALPVSPGWEAGSFYEEFARMLMGFRAYQDAWRLQVLSDLAVLPDYEDGNVYWQSRGQTRGAPVDEKGSPILYSVPARYEAAANDGERWRWMLKRAVDHDRSRAQSIQHTFAGFLCQQFGVETLAWGGWQAPRMDEDDPKAATATLALHTLGDNETVARLATGIKRFTLPDEFDFIRLYRDLASDAQSGYAELALNSLAGIFTNRRQYPQAAAYWRESIKAHGPGSDNWKQKKLDQILGNLGRFEPSMTHPAGPGASLEYRFRNGAKVVFDAREIKVPELLADLKDYLKSNPRELDWNRMSLDNIGMMLVEKNQAKYLGREAARWELPLTPKAHHFDKVVTVKTGLKTAGAYLLTATMAHGNVSKIVVWVNDTVIARKQTVKASLYYVADAVTGKPLGGVNVECFGYRQEYIQGWKSMGRQFNVLTTAFAETTDPDGQVSPAKKDLDPQYQWLVTATTADGRLAVLGFSSVWYGQYYDHDYNERKIFGITDRPVYRPDQKVNFKFWIRHARYDEDNTSDYADKEFTVVITNPKGDKVFEKAFKTDAVAGLQGEMALPKDAALGQYYASIKGCGWGGVNFRVEEYKKPEFEVSVDAPKEPVMLGESITATIKAKYYFGTAVTKAKVKVKVTRSSYSATWYPPMPWDWFYGPGYWWFASDSAWFPGWKDWGCFCPRGWWWPAPYNPPELVAEAEVPIGADGVVKLPIDTALAKELHGDTDHKYEITAEVTDESRRTIVGQGTVLVARKPFKVTAWVDRGHYRPGDVIRADFAARTLDGKPVKGRGQLVLYRIKYKDGAPAEKVVRKWDLDTNEEGLATQQIQASAAGQYRLSYTVKDEKRHSIEGGYVFVVRGEGFDGRDFKFSEIELIPENREYRPGEKVRLMINTDHPGATILLFVRPANGVYLRPKLLRLVGKSTVEEIEVMKKDMPSFFVEAMTVFDGRVYSQTREIIVPPEKRVLNVEVLPSVEKYKPGETAKIKVRVTDFFGKPLAGSTVMSVYDKSVEYISGGSNVAGIRDFFWKWRRQHTPRTESNTDRWFPNLTPNRMLAMDNLGLFGETVVDEVGDDVDSLQSGFKSKKDSGGLRRGRFEKSFGGQAAGMAMSFVAMDAPAASGVVNLCMEASTKEESSSGGESGAVAEPTVRSEFADTAYWNPSLATDSNGMAEVSFKMPENLTGWKIKTWAMGQGTMVGEGVAEVVTAKNVMLRLQAPRFFVEKDEVVLSANIHNALKSDKSVQAVLEVEGGCLEIMGKARQTLKIKAGDEQRVDWRVKVVKEGRVVVRMKALTDEESDAMEMKFPVYVHGMLKTESWSGVLRPDRDRQDFTITVPAERRPGQSRLEIRYSPTLAGALVDALPYLVDYPYGCTEQTLNRFLPTVLVQKSLKDMGLDLKTIQAKRTNLNAQEIGDDQERAAQWKRNNPPNPGEERNPVFDEAVVNDMVKQGLKALTAMQCDDGGWGWFSGWGERSWPHTTATVVHGLQIAKQNGVALVPGVLERGVDWLGKFQAEELRKLRNASLHLTLLDCKDHADDMDAFVYMVLVDAGRDNSSMREYLYNGRTNLSVYAKAMFGLALHTSGQVEKRDMILRNIGQYVVRDPENQTAYLNLGNSGYWWCWYGSENEAHAYYLKLLAATAPKGEVASELVKYLLNNRKHASYWNSTRDTALCIEAMADYLKASGEDKPDMTVEVFLDGTKVKESRITADNLFLFDNKLVLEGAAVTTGTHQVEVRRRGTGPVYFNAYLTNFTLEDPIKRAGLEIKVNRSVYKLIPANKTIKAAGSRGQALDQKVEKYERKRLTDGDTLKSGDLVEVELEIASKNDYEYIIFEDMKAAGFEAVEVRSGFNGNDLGAFVEFRDERVCFFVRQLARGQNSVSYRLRAEIPGIFSALPTKASAMYAPELKANSDEIKLRIED
jgi:uncharacterized protein YfaS (alpha-2-macroglobulin family)